MRNRLSLLLTALFFVSAFFCSLPTCLGQDVVILSGPGWQVIRAEWGASDHWMNVTYQLRALLSGSGMVRVNNQNMGGDPAVGAEKHLRILARNEEGQSREFSFKEGSSINAGEFYNYDAGISDDRPGWRVLWADYGIGNRRVNVTERVRALLSGSVMVRVNNENMGGDPAVGADKALRISARDARGEIQHFIFKEGSTIDASQFYNYAGYSAGPGYRPDRPGDRDRDREFRPGLHIIRAYYGLNNRTADVTELLRGMVRGDSLVVPVNNANMGGDPAVGADKVLTVIYRINGVEQTATVKEGNTLRIP